MNCTAINTVVIGRVHHNTLGVVRALGEAGIKRENVHAIIIGENVNKKNIISKSKYICASNISYLSSYEEIVPHLKKRPLTDEKDVIICCSDESSEAIMNGKEELCDKYKMPECLLNAAELMIKSKQADIAIECGLNVPESGDFLTDAIDWHDYPCIIKPYKSIAGAGKSDIRIVHSEEELNDTVKSLQASKIQIQKYIDKEMEFQLIGCSLDAGEKIIIPGFTKLLRQPKNTNTGYLIYSPIEELNFDMTSVEKFIKKIGYSGLFSVEFIRGKDGKDYFLEINMRNDGNAYCVTRAGVNLPYIWAHYQKCGEMPEVPLSFKKAIYFIPDFSDLKIARKKIGLLKWIKEFRQAEAHSIYNKKDMKPFRFEFKRQIKRIFTR